MSTFIPNPAYESHSRTTGQSLTRGMAFSLLFAVLIALSAQVAVPLPFTDVPATLQVFAVLVAGGLLGARWGTLSVLQYLAIGAAGAPVFTQWKGGYLALMGPTGGYLIGFALAAFCMGYAADLSRSKTVIGAAVFLGILIIWLCGALWRHYALGLAWPVVLQTSLLPFVAADLLKGILAWGVIVRTPRVMDRR